MQKQLSWLPWVMATLALGILVCIGLIVYMLFFQSRPEIIHAGAQLVKEAFANAQA